jgi:diaminopimelate epimerase
MIRKFVKMHGLGNDFAIFDGRAQRFEMSAEQIRALADRRTGIGFDQMVVIGPARSAGADAFLTICNADGSETGACGNATRCVAKLLMEESGKAEAALETKAALLRAALSGGKILVDMGEARLGWREIPLSRAEDTLSLPVAAGALENPAAVNVGNPHAVFFVEDADKVALETLGPLVERHPLFPERVNVGVAQALSPERIRLRVWERGAGITRACGTGACAAVVAGALLGLTRRKATVALDGGALDIEWRESDNHVLMTGDAAEVYRGEVRLSPH